MRFRLLGHRGLAGHGLREVREQAQVVGEDLRAEAHCISCGDGGVRPDFQRQLVIVCHVAYTGVFYGVVHLVDGRIDRIHGDGADGHVGRLVLIGRDVSAAMAQRDLHIEAGVGAKRADVLLGVEDLNLAVGLDVAGGDFALARGVNIDGLGALAVELRNDLLHVQHDLRDVFLDAGDRGELVLHARDLDGGRGGAGQRGKKNSAQGVAERGAVSPFQRLYDIFAVGDVFLGIDTLDTRLFNFYHE